jgi:hypothetical protein
MLTTMGRHRRFGETGDGRMTIEEESQTKEKTRGARSIPKWESEGQNRLRQAIRRFAKPLSELIARDANEGDTRLLVTDFLCEALGFDKYENLTTEYAVRGEFADYGVRIDKQLVAFIEVKRTTTRLSERHLRQIEMYSVNEGVEWMILTNGAAWQAYHLAPGMPVQIDLALNVDLLNDAPIGEKAAQLFYLSLPSLKRRQIDDLWKAKRATSPKSLATVLCTPSVIEMVKRELRRATGHVVDVEELRLLLRETVIRSECL